MSEPVTVYAGDSLPRLWCAVFGHRYRSVHVERVNASISLRLFRCSRCESIVAHQEPANGVDPTR